MDDPVAYPTGPNAPTADPGPSTLRCAAPGRSDGGSLHTLARLAGGLDVNSPYSYHLWCRDFARTSTVAWAGAEPVGFVTGFRRPEAPDRLFVWQVAVHPDWRGHHIGTAMLHDLVDREEPPRFVEATVTPSNTASRRMFEGFAAQHGAPVVDRPFLAADQFPDAHESEILLEIGPFPPRPPRDREENPRQPREKVTEP
jgi:L-2,4-diaminobutyric acid acetyltransferase